MFIKSFLQTLKYYMSPFFLYLFPSSSMLCIYFILIEILPPGISGTPMRLRELRKLWSRMHLLKDNVSSEQLLKEWRCSRLYVMWDATEMQVYETSIICACVWFWYYNCIWDFGILVLITNKFMFIKLCLCGAVSFCSH